jgi:hypothetical protein
LISLFSIPIYYPLIKVYPTLVPLGTGFSGRAKTGMIPSAYPISKSIPSEISHPIFSMVFSFPFYEVFS